MQIPTTPQTTESFPSRSRLSALAQCRCPRCRQGRMYPYRAYYLPGLFQMHDECPHCGQDFRIEPGFYMGASYIGYGMFSLMIVTLALVYFGAFPEMNEWLAIGFILLVSALMVPLNFRYSRALMLHLFGSIGYDPKVRERQGMVVTASGELEVTE